MIATYAGERCRQRSVADTIIRQYIRSFSDPIDRTECVLVLATKTAPSSNEHNEVTLILIV